MYNFFLLTTPIIDDMQKIKNNGTNIHVYNKHEISYNSAFCK